MRRILAALTLLALVSGAISQTVTKVDSFDYVCEQVADLYENPDVCKDIDAPIVVRSRVLELDFWRVLNGMYIPGEPYVFVHPRATMRTVEHEMVHYVLTNAGLVAATNLCEHERVARFIAGQAWDDRAKNIYGCQQNAE